jgi:hypothetical protein
MPNTVTKVRGHKLKAPTVFFSYCPLLEVAGVGDADNRSELQGRIDGRSGATALGYGIHTQGDTLEELRTMVKDAVDCYFDETMEAPQIVRLRERGSDQSSQRRSH